MNVVIACYFTLWTWFQGKFRRPDPRTDEGVSPTASTPTQKYSSEGAIQTEHAGYSSPAFKAPASLETATGTARISESRSSASSISPAATAILDQVNHGGLSSANVESLFGDQSPELGLEATEHQDCPAPEDTDS